MWQLAAPPEVAYFAPQRMWSFPMANRTLVALTAAAAIVVMGSGGARLEVALEDRGDPNPRQVQVGMKVASSWLGLAISWTACRATAR